MHKVAVTMSDLDRLRDLAGITSEADTGDDVERTVAGHVDNEKDMIMKQLYQMGAQCVELYKLMATTPDNSDYPHWWQGKVIKASDYLDQATEYLTNELQAPEEPQE